MKISFILSAMLALTSSAIAGVLPTQPDIELETLSASAARELPGVSLQISLEKSSFESGEPIAVTFHYRNQSGAPVTFIRSGTSYSPMRVVQREFRARQLDGDALLQSKTPQSGIISEMVGSEIIEPQQSVREIVFPNERFFLERAGRYKLTAWSNAVSLNGKKRWLQSTPVELQIVPATETFKTQVLREAKMKIDAARARALGRSLGSFPHELQIASQAAKRLGWLHDERAIPILVSALEIGNNSHFDAQHALRSYPRAAVKAGLRRRLDDGNPAAISRNSWLQLGADTPAEKQEIEAQLDTRLRVALNKATDRRKRGYLAMRGLEDSPALRRDPKFWHEALTNLAIQGQNLGFDIYSLLSVPGSEEKTRAAEYPIQTADLKAALESKAPLQVRTLLFQALKTRDPLYLRQFLLARVDNFSFDYPRGVFDVFNDAQMQSVAAKLMVAIQNPDSGSDSARRDDYGRRLRDLALRGATIAQLEKTESWLLQNAPDADAPILDAIALKMPSRTWLWLKQSLAKRPLQSPYDNRMRVLVLQKNPAARQIVRGLLQGSSEQRSIEVLNAIYGTVAEPWMEESRARWISGEQVFPRANALTFDDLRNDMAKLTTAKSDAVKQAAKRAYNAVIALKE